MNKNILTLTAAVLLCTMLAACGGDKGLNNPLNVEAPAWQQFAHPKGNNKPLYKEATENSPVLKVAIAPSDGDSYETKIFWSDEKGPRGWYAESWIVNDNDVYPILGEEGDFYKLYVFNEVVGAKEAYAKKTDFDIVKPIALTQEIIDSIGKTEIRCDNIIKEGELQNLCFSSFEGDYDEPPFVTMGQLCGNCIIYPRINTAYLNVVTDKAPITFTKTEDNESYTLNVGEDQLYQPNSTSAIIFDTKKLSEELIKQMYNDLKQDGAEIKEVLYYIPEVNKERFIHIIIFPSDNKTEVVSTEQQVVDDPETVARQVIERAMARDVNGVRELMTGSDKEIEGYAKILILAFSEVRGYNITKCEVNGDRARVRYTVKFKYDSEKDKFDLVKTADGSWKLSASGNGRIKVM